MYGMLPTRPLSTKLFLIFTLDILYIHHSFPFARRTSKAAARKKKVGYFCSLGPHLEKTIKMFSYDDQISHGVSTIPVLRSTRIHLSHDPQIIINA